MSRSGASQVFECGLSAASRVEISGPGQGFSGITLDNASSTFASVGGGIRRQHPSGSVVRSGSFTVDETDVTLPLLLGMNGQRFNCSWTRYSGATAEVFVAVFTVTHTGEPRGKRVFSVAFSVDGGS